MRLTPRVLRALFCFEHVVEVDYIIKRHLVEFGWRDVASGDEAERGVDVLQVIGEVDLTRVRATAISALRMPTFVTRSKKLRL